MDFQWSVLSKSDNGNGQTARVIAFLTVDWWKILITSKLRYPNRAPRDDPAPGEERWKGRPIMGCRTAYFRRIVEFHACSSVYKTDKDRSTPSVRQQKPYPKLMISSTSDCPRSFPCVAFRVLSPPGQFTVNLKINWYQSVSFFHSKCLVI